MAKKKPSKNSLHSKFHSAIASSSRFRAAEGEGWNPWDTTGTSRKENPKGRNDRSMEEEYAIQYANAQELSQRNLPELIRQAAQDRTRSSALPAGTPYPEEPNRHVKTSTRDKEMLEKSVRRNKWKTHSVYKTEPKAKKTMNRFINEEMAWAPEHVKWLNKQLDDPKSEFNRGLDLHAKKTGRYTQGQRERISAYTDALQEGKTHTDAFQRVRSAALHERVGRPKQRARTAQVSRARQALTPARPSGRAVDARYQTLIPSDKGFNFGVTAAAPPKLEDLKKLWPDTSEKELIRIQQSATEMISEDILANQKWAHETRRATLLGQKSGRIKETPDKVTIFTTNLGHPAVSVPSDSLVGQYIIKKRKAVFAGYGVPASQMKGAFPAALQDKHIVDYSLGTSYGVQGKHGLFSNTGYRVGRKNSPGYGNPRPVGASIVYDSAGRPMYDSQGNIRYTEGALRPVEWASPTIGFRILMG